MTATQTTPLPHLRDELQLLPGAPGVRGEPTWLIHDPMLNSFIQIDAATYETLRHWRECRTGEELVARINASGRAAIDEASLGQLIQFLFANRLTAQAQQAGWRQYAREREARRKTLLGAAVHCRATIKVRHSVNQGETAPGWADEGRA